MNTIVVSVRLFGAIRDFSKTAEIPLRVRCGATIAEIKEELRKNLLLESSRDPSELLLSSALASENRVLRDGDAVEAGARLAILPPVCGG